ncbi:hypothetical protein M3Y94_01216700 [Aphelenchoides besseyi]|nr:hypothetical protein M3Y94_01216700 [Aphelenchoides besseyi]KAI6219761.1 hypothetical protein M3Y95_01100800 [Aphelenchoides besseyi]
MALFQLLFVSILIAGLHAMDPDGCFTVATNTTIQLKGGSGQCTNASGMIYFKSEHIAITMNAYSITKEFFWIGMGITAPCALNVTVSANNGSGASGIDIDGKSYRPSVFKVYSNALFFGNETKAAGICGNTTFFEGMAKREGWKQMPIALVNQLVNNFTMDIYTTEEGSVSLIDPTMAGATDSAATSSFNFYSITSKLLFVVGLFFYFH